jgi:hypothetical protein
VTTDRYEINVVSPEEELVGGSSKERAEKADRRKWPSSGPRIPGLVINDILERVPPVAGLSCSTRASFLVIPILREPEAARSRSDIFDGQGVFRARVASRNMTAGIPI